EHEYGHVLRAVPFSDKTTPRQILRQWERTCPDVSVAEGVFRTWFDKHRAAADLETIHGYVALEARAGEKLRQFQGEGRHSSFKLVRELRSQAGLNTTDAVMREWMRHHGGGAPSWCSSAQDLEQRVGQRLREYLAEETAAGDADSIKQWLADQQIACPIRIIKHWLNVDFSPEGAVESGEALELAIGDVLRSIGYSQFFESEVSRGRLVEHLKGLDPPIRCTLDVLAAWCGTFYPGPGGNALEADSAHTLDTLLGEDRVHYALDGARPLVQHLASRWQPFQASHKVCRTWLESLPDALKSAARARSAPRTLNARRLRQKSKDPLPLLQTFEDVERVLGQLIVRKYTCDNMSAYDISKDLKREFHVAMRPYNLQQWLGHPAQRLTSLQSVQDIESHGCANFVLDQMQTGVPVERVAHSVRREYLVIASAQTLRAYRRYKEQAGNPRTAPWIEQRWWRWLYEQITEGSSFGRPNRGGVGGLRMEVGPGPELSLLLQRFCDRAELSIGMVPMPEFRKFFNKHEQLAQLRAIRRVQHGEPLPESAGRLLRDTKADGVHEKVLQCCAEVAAADKMLCFPVNSAVGNTTVAYAASICEDLHACQTWAGSSVGTQHRGFCRRLPDTDFAIWACYGSWQHCPCCGCFSFNDEGFKSLYNGTSAQVPASEVLHSRREIPSDPVKHSGHAELGPTSYWWVSPTMYKPSASVEHACGKCTPAAEHPRPIAHPGEMAARILRAKARAKAAARARPAAKAKAAAAAAAIGADKMEPVLRTQQLYRVPRLPPVGQNIPSTWAGEVASWPRLAPGASEFSMSAAEGCTFLDFSHDEKKALRVIVIHVQKKQEMFSANPNIPSHYKNWKKTGVSKGFYAPHIVDERSLPTARCKAAFRWLVKNNGFYEAFLNASNRTHTNPDQHGQHIRTFDLLVTFKGVECAAWPWLYPTADFTDT
ncbi:unnamed protein product, partial [Prorocentrum cordatum]